MAGFEIVSFPYCPTDKVIDGIDSAEGVYINFLQVVAPRFFCQCSASGRTKWR